MEQLVASNGWKVVKVGRQSGKFPPPDDASTAAANVPLRTLLTLARARARVCRARCTPCTLHPRVTIASQTRAGPLPNTSALP